MSSRVCPVCKSEDWLRYVFVESYDNELSHLSTENPTDGMHFLFVCPSLHVYDEDGNRVERREET